MKTVYTIHDKKHPKQDNIKIIAESKNQFKLMLLVLLPQIYYSIKSDEQFTENPYDSLEQYTVLSKNFEELTADQKIDEMLHHINVMTAQMCEMLSRLNNNEQKLELLTKGFLAITENTQIYEIHN